DDGGTALDDTGHRAGQAVEGIRGQRRRTAMTGQVRRYPAARPPLGEQRPPPAPHVAGRAKAVQQHQNRLPAAALVNPQPSRHSPSLPPRSPSLGEMSPARPARPDAEVVFDPATYVDGVPFEALARLRTAAPVAWLAEVPVLGWPAGPGFWLVLRHADVESVLARPRLFSSALGATQIRDPARPQALGYVRQMMLDMGP